MEIEDMAKRTEELAVTPETVNALAVAEQGVVPSFIEQGSIEGAEGIAAEDARVPRLVLAQSQTPAAMKGNSAYIDGLTAGVSFNDLTGQVYGDGPLDVIVVRADKPRWVLFGEDRGVIDPDVKPGSPKTQFTTNEKGERERPEATMFMDYVFLVGTEMEPLAASFKGSAVKLTARPLNGLIKMKPVPIYACCYRLTPKYMTNDQGNWYVYTVKQVGMIASEETYRKAKEWFNTFKLKEVAFETSPQAQDVDDDTLENAQGAEGTI